MKRRVFFAAPRRHRSDKTFREFLTIDGRTPVHKPEPSPRPVESPNGAIPALAENEAGTAENVEVRPVERLKIHPKFSDNFADSRLENFRIWRNLKVLQLCEPTFSKTEL